MNASSNGGDPRVSSSAEVDDAQQAAEQMLHDLKHRAADYVEQGKQTAADMATAVEKQIRQRPVEAVAVAAGIGFALGLLWTRRSS